MGYNEAIADNIKIARNKYGDVVYFPICSVCGKNEVSTPKYKSDLKYTCKECKLEKELTEKKMRKENSRDLKERKYQKALSRILNIAKGKDKDKYLAAGEKVYKKLFNLGWFDSTEEIMVAIELIKSGVKARHQVKFGTRYSADFVLSDLEIVLEVDGVTFHNERTRQKEELRDALIIAALGGQWEVIRITDELINQNITKLVPAILKVKEKRMKVRSENKGILPKWYTDRKMA